MVMMSPMDKERARWRWFHSAGEQMTILVGQTCFAKIIDSTEDFE